MSAEVVLLVFCGSLSRSRAVAKVESHVWNLCSTLDSIESLHCPQALRWREVQLQLEKKRLVIMAGLVLFSGQVQGALINDNNSHINDLIELC